MSNLALPNGDDYPAAARKHLTDAEKLIDAGRFDGAGYLVGYAVECSLRTVIMVGEIARRGGIPRGSLARELKAGSRTLERFRKVAAGEARSKGGDHDLDALAQATTTYAAELNAASARYAPAIDTKQPPFGDRRTHQLRYKASGAVVEADARAWYKTAEIIYTESVGAMIRDGVVVR